MKRRVFFSFHYKLDFWRTWQVRNIGFLEGNSPVSMNNWETVRKKGDKAIRAWIDNQLSGRSCTIVLIGKETAEREWITYEIEKSWYDGKGVLGIYIHNLEGTDGKQSKKGRTPFDYVTTKNDTSKLSSVVKAYDPPYTTSKNVYQHISENLKDWVEEAIVIRNSY